MRRITLAQVNPAYMAVRRELVAHACLPQIDQAAQKILAREGFLCHPSDYRKNTTAYFAIELALRFLFPERKGLAILQVAPNYGPYLHYLRMVVGVTGAAGIDNNLPAIRYSQEIGSNVTYGDATQLDIPPQSQDVVITHHFLDIDYFVCPPWVVRCQIADILKPGGYHVSDQEVHTWHASEISHYRFSECQRFSKEVTDEYLELERLCVFQKKQ